MDNQNVIHLLTEIRDAQSSHQEQQLRISTESIAMQKESLAMQREAVERQRTAVDAQIRHLRLYRRVLVVAALVIAGCVGFMLTLRG